jgi:hypothetical protein
LARARHKFLIHNAPMEKSAHVIGAAAVARETERA